MKRYVLINIIFLLFSIQLYPQLFQESYKTRYDSIYNDKGLNLNILASTFFINNEFFNPSFEGYTLIGAFLQPELVHTVNPKLDISAGVHLREYFGDDDGVSAEPLLTILYRPLSSLSLTMGSFEGGNNHRLPETVYSFENHFSNLIENGLLINFNKSFLESRLWLDWEKFIERGDPFREEFTAGITNRLKVLIPGKLGLEIPIYVLARHMGGQIDESPLPVTTFYNLSQGINVFKPVAGSKGIYPYGEFLIHECGYEGIDGYAVELAGGAKTGGFEANAGYFHGDNFRSFKGLPLFHSNAQIDLITFKAGYKAKIAERSFLFLRFGGYYNTGAGMFDYTYGVDMQINLKNLPLKH